MKFKTEPTDQGKHQGIIPGAEAISEREMLERRMNQPTKPTAPQKRVETTPLFGAGLPPHQDRLL